MCHEENDKLRKQFARHANAFNSWLTETRAMMMEGSNTLEEQLAAVGIKAHEVGVWRGLRWAHVLAGRNGAHDANQKPPTAGGERQGPGATVYSEPAQNRKGAVASLIKTEELLLLMTLQRRKELRVKWLLGRIGMAASTRSARPAEPPSCPPSCRPTPSGTTAV